MKVVYSRSAHGCFLYGRPDQVVVARSYLTDLASWTSLVLPWSRKHMTVLLANQGHLCHSWEHAFHVIIHIEKSEKRMMVEGGTRALDVFYQHYQTFFKSKSLLFQPCLIV